MAPMDCRSHRRLRNPCPVAMLARVMGSPNPERPAGGREPPKVARSQASCSNLNNFVVSHQTPASHAKTQKGPGLPKVGPSTPPSLSLPLITPSSVWTWVMVLRRPATPRGGIPPPFPPTHTHTSAHHIVHMHAITYPYVHHHHHQFWGMIWRER